MTARAVSLIGRRRRPAMWVYRTESYGSSTRLRSLLTGRTELPAST
jgi:hypothetical protein